MILMIDNYDSFTWNLVQYLGELGDTPVVKRNDAITPDEIAAMKPRAIVISPGPGRPDDAGVSKDVIRRFSGSVPILGVCLGHQCIGEVFGGRVVQAERLVHGKTSAIIHTGRGLFLDVDNPFQATRYHSLIVAREGLPDALQVMAWTPENEIMALRHREHETWGVQFHPESILTTSGKDILRNFLLSLPAPATAAR
ncbi:MAG TPA: aminodeoxychorismate/anthranilate synthase component II [Candidatus Eisenbacteria bacterium]|jgi:anthranilate synthase/aminodeoxychorismate synthase-like glutamine amidotransferase|nr:aminodeoxychorismate/anthranilate synthase component II [Candidatus Eisenbacteria bacterium]